MESLTNNNTQKEIEKNDQILNKNSSNILSKILNSSIPETNIQKKNYESEENNFKNSFSLNDMTYINLNEKPQKIINENNIFEQEENLFYDLISYIKECNIGKIEEILKEKPHFINKISNENLTPLQYSILYSDLQTFKKILEYKPEINVKVEGIPIIHLSLLKCIFKKEQKRCSEIFHYIIEKYPEQKNYIDRLGRTYLHIIFQYDFSEALKGINVLINELFKIDNNGDYVINYAYKYNSIDSFVQIIQNFQSLKELYLKIREESKLNQGLHYKREEVFFENCIIHHAYGIIGFIVLNCFGFDNEVKYDMEAIIKRYSNITHIVEERFYGINSIYYNALIAHKSWERLHSKNNINREEFKFDFKNEIRKTGIIYNNNCLFHLELPDDNIKRIKRKKEIKDDPDRFNVLISENKNGILNNDLFDSNKFIILKSEREACINDILKCHDITYIQNIKNKCDNISKINSLKNKNNINKNKNNNLQIEKINNIEIEKDENKIYKIEKINSDTFISKNTFKIMTSTIGSIFDGIDLVISGKCSNAFIIIRPPGHNVGYFGSVENNFNKTNNCIINNACIGAAYARYKYRNDGISKIAIFDYNAFCGKGSEEIIQMLHCKVFSKDMNIDKIGKINIRKDKNINWLNFDDAKNILYISTHIQNYNNDKNYSYGNNINNTKEDDEIYPAGIFNIPFNSKQIYSYEFRNVIRSKVIPRLYKFKPDLIILCSGFDGHELEDNGNQMFLQEYDYAFLTEQLQFFADHYSKKMLISILEEGYNIKSGIISSFAQSVFTHVRYLNLAANMHYIFDVKLNKNKRKSEYENDLEIFKKIERFKNVENINKVQVKDNFEKENVVNFIHEYDAYHNSNGHDKIHTQNKIYNIKNIVDVPKNLIKRKTNNNVI